MSFIDLNKIIEYNGGEINDNNAKKYCYESYDFNKFYNEDIHYFKIGCFKDNEIIGLDYFLKNDKFICDCEVYSINCSVFELENNLYLNLLNEIQVFKLGCFKDNEIIGLDNFLKDKKFFCDCEVNSISVSLYELEDNLYQNLLNDIQLRSNIENYIEQKKKILCERLIKIRDTKIENAINNIRNSNKNKNFRYHKDNNLKKGNLI